MDASHSSITQWIKLVEAEFREMPGLHLTKPQVQRYWSLDSATCDLLLNTLESLKFLRRTPKDAYVRADLGL